MGDTQTPSKERHVHFVIEGGVAASRRSLGTTDTDATLIALAGATRDTGAPRSDVLRLRRASNPNEKPAFPAFGDALRQC